MRLPSGIAARIAANRLWSVLTADDKLVFPRVFSILAGNSTGETASVPGPRDWRGGKARALSGAGAAAGGPARWRARPDRQRRKRCVAYLPRAARRELG